MQIKGDTIVCKIFYHVACFGCGKGIATSYDEKAVRKMAREAGAKKMLIGDGNPIKQWYCKSCAAQQSAERTADKTLSLGIALPDWMMTEKSRRRSR